MRWHNETAVWENRRRLERLNEFRNDLVAYFNDSKAEWMVDARIEGAEAQKARGRINLTLDESHAMILAAGVHPVVRWTPPPVVGGYVQDIDLVMNVFQLHRFRIPPNDVLGIIERAIGIYQNGEPRAFRRTINPLWWLSRLLVWFARLPFFAIEAAGFNSVKAERSLIGRLVKVILLIIPVIASVLTILSLMGWLNAFKASLGIGA